MTNQTLIEAIEAGNVEAVCQGLTPLENEPELAQWMVAAGPAQETALLELLARIGKVRSRRHEHWRDPALGQVQLQLLESWLQRHPDSIEQLKGMHIWHIDDVVFLQRLVLDRRSPGLLRETALENLCVQFARLEPGEGFPDSLELLRKVAADPDLQAIAVQGLAGISATQMRASALLQDANVDVHALALRGLLARDNADTIPLLQETLAMPEPHWSDLQRARILDHLEHLGQDVSSLDPLFEAGVDGFEAMARERRRGRRSDPLARLWNARLAESDLPFSGTLMQWCADLICAEDWGRMPRQVRQLWSRLPQENRAALAFRLVESWGQGVADNRDRWVLMLAGAFGDDRLVPLLRELASLWGKSRFQRASEVVQALAEFDTTHALFVLDEIHKSPKYRDSVRAQALQGLKAAAARRRVSLEELYDELVPTLDLGPDGLMLDVGPCSYQVRLLPDLTLSITHSHTGKVTRSLPKAKPEEDPELRAMAMSRFAHLKKNIKPLVKQLGPRLQEAFECGKAWPAERWHRLFLQHPILNLVGRSLVWSYRDGDRSCSFRISEDGSLIDLDDSAVTLGNGEVCLWHPLEASAEEIDGWRAHLADYELAPFIIQTEAPVYFLALEERTQSALERFSNARVPWGKLKRLMTKWGFAGYQESTCILRYEHLWSVSHIRVEIGMLECCINMAFDEDCVFGVVRFMRSGNGSATGIPLPLTNVPPRLISTMIGKLTELTTS